MKSFVKLLPIVFSLSIIAGSCKKYLDAKSDKSLVIIESLKDLQSILDRTDNNWSDPGSSEVASDNYFLSDADFGNLTDLDKNLYKWNESDVFPTGKTNDWSRCYDNVFKSNTVLFHLDKINPDDQVEWNNIKGQALFLRAKSFLLASSIWALAYDESTASTDLGIPLRLDPDINLPSVRTNVQETYARIIKDLQESIFLLPTTPLHVLRASKPAAYALLARTYLFMRKYDKALLYADSCLQLRNTLMDYNINAGGVNPNAQFPFTQFNSEVIYDNRIPYPTPLIYAKIDTNLFNSYSSADLRKKLFYTNLGGGPFAFEGNYAGNTNLWDGIATDEVYLTRAECYARNGNVTEAMKDLNALMIKRWNNSSWIPFSAADISDAVKKILAERRKELVFRGLRWMDIKRLNKEGENITLRRNINNQTYTLQPGDLRFAMPIPEDLIALFGIQQNIR